MEASLSAMLFSTRVTMRLIRDRGVGNRDAQGLQAGGISESRIDHAELLKVRIISMAQTRSTSAMAT